MSPRRGASDRRADLRDKYANLGGKLDLNNANHDALRDRLQSALPVLTAMRSTAWHATAQLP